MSLQFHNTRTRSIEAFSPLHEGHVSLYTCGPTVYNSLHVGNWAAYVYWDTLVRTLKDAGLNVNRVMNITDVGHLVSDGDEGEDKLEKGARREGKTAWEIAQHYTDDFVQGMEALNLTPADHIVKATDFIPQQLELVRTLKAKGHTYEITDGIYFDTSTFPQYGEFAHLDLEAQKAGARVEFNPEKRNPSDFALWKFTPESTTRDMQWATPADLTDDGTEKQGFPGWHLECSAMAMDLLGPSIDIHTGGIDHIPVHHTNEIAQSEAATGKRFSNVWLHNNHLKVNGTKISKSLENGYTLQDIAEHGFTAIDLRLFILQSHYRTEGNFTFELLEAAQARLRRWKAVAALRHQVHGDATPDGFHEHLDSIASALQDDLNTPVALSHVDELFDALEQHGLQLAAEPITQALETVDSLLGLRLMESTPDISDHAKTLIQRREMARENKDWATSDALRDELLAQKITIRDTADGSIWEYAS